MARKKKSEPKEYRAVFGDTLTKISMKIGKNVLELRQLNPDILPGVGLNVGKKVNI